MGCPGLGLLLTIIQVKIEGQQKRGCPRNNYTMQACTACEDFRVQTYAEEVNW